MKLWHVPLRLATGVFVLNSGLSKRGADKETAGGLHGMAASAYPQLKSMDPEQFVSLLSKTEIALGAALLLPVVPSSLAGLGLTAFSGGLNGLYWRAPGLRQEGDIRPTPEGLGIAKDVWMTAAGLALLVDRVTTRDG